MTSSSTADRVARQSSVWSREVRGRRREAATWGRREGGIRSRREGR